MKKTMYCTREERCDTRSLRGMTMQDITSNDTITSTHDHIRFPPLKFPHPSTPLQSTTSSPSGTPLSRTGQIGKDASPLSTELGERPRLHHPSGVEDQYALTGTHFVELVRHQDRRWQYHR